MKRSSLILLFTLIAFGCREQQAPDAAASASAAPSPLWQFGTPRELALPETGIASVPSIATTSDNRLLLGWMEELEKKKRYRFRLATRTGEQWSQPAEIRTGDDFFVNWADTPNVVMTSDGTIFAQWLQRSGAGTYDYAIHIARSSDGGGSWSKPVVPHSTARPSEFGFVSMLPDPAQSNSVALAWLDGRDMQEEGVGEMAIRYAQLDAAGVVSQESVLDSRVCECCQTGMTMVNGAPVVVYRDRDPGELRDTGIVRKSGSSWTQPALVHRDAWKMPGCPVNGPQIEAAGENVAVAWFTGSEEKNRVFAAFSTDGGATFGKPLLVSSEESLGRVGLEMIDADHVAVSWMEKQGERAPVRMRVIARNGTMTEPVTIGATSSSRASGFPRITRRGDNLVVVWTIAGDASRIAMSEIPLQRVPR